MSNYDIGVQRHLAPQALRVFRRVAECPHPVCERVRTSEDVDADAGFEFDLAELVVQVSDRRCVSHNAQAFLMGLRDLVVKIRPVLSVEVLVECDVVVPWYLLNIA